MISEHRAISLAISYHNYLVAFEAGDAHGEYCWALSLVKIGREMDVWVISEDTLIRRMTLAAQRLGGTKMKPFHHYTRKAEDILTEYLLKDNLSICEVVAVTKTRFELVRYMASHEMAEEKYQEAFGGLMKTLDHPDFADRWVAKRVRTWVRAADVAHICERDESLKHLLEQ